MSKFDSAAVASGKGPGVVPSLNVGNDGNLKDNQDGIVLLASGIITANGNSADQVNNNCKGIILFITPGAFGATESAMTVTIEGKDPVSGAYYTILQSAALVASTAVILRVYPGLTASANLIASDVLPPTWRVIWAATAWGTGGSTLGISAAIIV